MSNHDFTPEYKYQNEFHEVKKSLPHKEIFKLLLDQIERIDFRERANFKDEKGKINHKHYLVTSIETIIEVAIKNHWGMCQNNDSVYLYNGEYWKLISKEELQMFLGLAAEKLGVDVFDSRHYDFRDKLLRQFFSAANLPRPDSQKEVVLINLKNGTFEICLEYQKLREPNRQDFITYQLPFEYNPKVLFPMFQAYLNRVLPDIALQKILAEYIAYLFVSSKKLKLEKALLLYGAGANGKSVFFEIINALLGEENVSSYSLQSLTNESGYYRAALANKLLNYTSEISGRLEASMFKQLVSGEPIEARLPHCAPFILSNYAKFIFNCNELPKEVEHTIAFFRRFLIIPFDVIIPEAEQDKKLANKIIENELAGVFNWVLEGMDRLLKNGNFTDSDIVRRQVANYKMQSDNVSLFLEDKNFQASTDSTLSLTDLYSEYKQYCSDSGYHNCAKRTFSERLKNIGIISTRKSAGIFVFIEKNYSKKDTFPTSSTFSSCHNVVSVDNEVVQPNLLL